MPSQEFKRIFQRGRMNLDLDDRLVPNGEYRYGFNVNIGRSEGADVGAVENLLGNELIPNSEAIGNGICLGSHRDNGNERIYFFVTNNRSIDDSSDGEHAIYEYDQIANVINRLASGTWLNFHENFTITGVNLVEDLLFWTDNRNEPRKINIDRARNDQAYYNSDDRASVIKFHPIVAPDITSVSTTTRVDDTGTPFPRSNFLENRLVRFAYRFRYEDGEFSTISPFTTTCFTPNTITTTAEEARNSGEISQLTNQIQQIVLNVPIPTRDLGIETVELIWKEQANGTVYIVEEKEVGDLAVVEFTYTGQDPFRALPGSQVTRVSDGVPRLAKSQEFAGGRLVYGNFLHQFDLPRINYTVGVRTGTEATAHPRFPNHSLKSRRTYQVGLVLADRFGRQTPIILSSSGNDTVSVIAQDGSPTEVLQNLTININNLDEIIRVAPWAYSYKVYVKQREQEYYNFFTDEAVFNTTTNELGPHQRTGDSINKIPVDTTQGTGGTNLPSTASVYPKLIETNILGVAGTANNVDSGLLTIQAINTIAAQVTIADDVIDTTIYETEPFQSNLDIFFETSTGGLLSTATGEIAVDYFNCYLLAVGTSHIEINRVRAGFNEAFFDYGVKASLVVDEFAEERRSNALIHSSGFFNSRTGINSVNQFNVDEGGLTISLDPSDGSVQKLFAEDTQMIIWQEDKVSRSPIDKDFIYSAEGGAVPVTSNTQYLGTIAPYAGEYGISRDPESFAVYGTRKYFTDKNRGVVLRLANDGLTEVSKQGMNDFFRDALRTSTRIIGSFDEYHDTYNLTINGTNYRANNDTNFLTAPDGYFTVSFEEDVQGWSSFKSFRQESGTTLNNMYYTFNGGNIWVHNSENVFRNTFYGNFRASELEMLFNDSPSVIKEFKTLSYEGTGDWDCEAFVTDFEDITPEGVNAPLIDTIRIQLNNSEDSLISNAVVRGFGPRNIEVGTQARWIIFVEPISNLFTFTATELPSVSLVLPPEFQVSDPILNAAERRIYWEVTTIGSITATVDAVVTATAISAVVGNLLEVSVRDNVANASLRQGSFFFGFTEEGFDEADNNQPRAFINIDPDDNHYFDSADQAADLNFGSTPVVINAMNEPVVSKALVRNGIQYGFRVSRPTSILSSSVIVNTATPEDGPNRFNPIRFGRLLADGSRDNRFVVRSIAEFTDLRLMTLENNLDNRGNIDLAVPGNNRNFISTTTDTVRIRPANGRVITDETNVAITLYQSVGGILNTTENRFVVNLNSSETIVSPGIGTHYTITPTLRLNGTTGLPDGSVNVEITYNYEGSNNDDTNRIGVDRNYVIEVSGTSELATLAFRRAGGTVVIGAAGGTIILDVDSNIRHWDVAPASPQNNFRDILVPGVDPVVDTEAGTITLEVAPNLTGVFIPVLIGIREIDGQDGMIAGGNLDAELNLEQAT